MKTLVIFGATGQQGSGVVKAALEDSQFKVRAVTRDATSEKAKQLAALGVEVVEADMDKLETLKKATQGCDKAFIVTNFWEHLSGKKEQQQIKNLIEAAQAAKIDHVVWSSLPDTRKILPNTKLPKLEGDWIVPHFDCKGETDQWFFESGVPTTVIYTTFYYDNLVAMCPPIKNPNGEYTLTFPMGNAKHLMMSAADIGRAAYGILKAGDKYKNKTIGIVGDSLTFDEISQSLSKALNVPIKYNPVPVDVYRSFGFPGVQEMANMFAFFVDAEKEWAEIHDIVLTKELVKGLKSFDSWF